MLVFLLLLFGLCDSYNILISVPTAEKSENTLVFEIASSLLDAGHNITLITGHKWNRNHENLNQIWIPETQNVHELLKDLTPLDWETHIFDLIGKYYVIKYTATWKDTRTMEIWNKRKTYDLFLTLSYYSEGVFPFLMDNDIPFVQLVTPGSELLALLRNGHLLSPAVSPSLMVIYDNTMTFWERTMNFINTISFYRDQNKVAKEYMKPVYNVFPELGDPERYYDRVSLTLINSHWSMDGSIPLLPNQVEIGAIHCKEAKPLEKVDKDLADFVEGSGELGIVYFSLGSIVQSADLPKEAKETLLEAFKRIPQRVLWKYEEEDLVHPPNVFIKKWMPQQDILGHPKTKVFISHCGSLSTQEAKYHGVPVLGLPLGFDQPRNCAKMVRKEYALKLSWEGLTVEKVVQSLNTLINDTSYRERMTRLSKIMRDQPDTPTERAVWWLEYLIRHKGAPHLQYAGKRLSVFQYIMLDVFLFWLTLFGLLIGFSVFLFRFICYRNRNKKIGESLGRNKAKIEKKIH